jgi:hypothetical protein
MDWTAVTVALIASSPFVAGIGYGIKKFVQTFWHVTVIEPRTELAELRAQQAAKDSTLATNAAAFDKMSASNDRLTEALGDFVETWRGMKTDFTDLRADVRSLIRAVERTRPAKTGGD